MRIARIPPSKPPFARARPTAAAARVRPGAQPGPDGLTDKQRVFVEQYLLVWNSAEAARRAGYSTKTARAIGWANQQKPEIRRAIDARLAALAMSAEEVLARLSDMARGDLSEFFSKKGGQLVLDLAAAAKAGKLHLVKKYRLGAGSESVELYDALAALQLLGRYHRLFTDVQEHQGSVDLVELSLDEWKAQAAQRRAAAAATVAQFGDSSVPAGDVAITADVGSNGAHDWPTEDDWPLAA